ncbi:hypothetical protein [uncultured Maribacter sp.]|uniref:hypothetical protein n=1 Tax=uncultured Maribacter sp. TaxID=431308 RepID=UPI00262B5EF3|nr:hypothetical protein [uncultured Maribacter sp.]
MNNNHSSTSFKKLLDKLQTESWQLELIISGFAIYGLWQSQDFLQIEYLKALKQDDEIYKFLLGPTINGVYILMIVLLIHVILRGLWIGTLGLRYVSGEIDYEELGYTDKFTNFLQVKVGSFDRYISRLENICSSLFALAFLMVFYFLSYFLIMGIFQFLVYLIFMTDWFSKTTSIILMCLIGIPYAICILFLFIDFLGMGILKKNEMTAKLYYPIYKVFNIISLSFIYRPLVYNFLDQKKARWVAIYILPFYFVISLFFTLTGNQNSNFQVINQASSSTFINKLNYEDQLIEKEDMIDFISISSKVIDKPYMKIFVGFNNFIEDAIIETDTTLKPENDKRGFTFQPEKMIQSMGSTNDPEKAVLIKQQKFLNVMNRIFKIKIDTMYFEKEFILTNNKNDRFGFETYIDLEGLEKGKHLVRFIGPANKKEKETKTKIDTLRTIPFWYFPENKINDSKMEIQLD